MSYLHLASNASSSSSPTPTSYLHVNSNGAVSTVPSSLGSNSPSLFGSVGTGKQWTPIGQSSSSSSTTNSSAQQFLIKQQQQQLALNNPSGNILTSSSSHFDGSLGLTMASALASSSQTQMEKDFALQQEDFPPLPHRSNSHEPTSSSSNNMSAHYQSQYSTTSSSSTTSSNHHSSIPNGYTSSQSEKFPSLQQQHSQSQSPISFKTPIDQISTLINRHPGSGSTKTSSLSNSLTVASQQLSNPASSTNTSNPTASTMINTNGLPSSTITDQYGLVGLLQLIQQVEKNPETATLLNCDLTTLGLSMESSNDLYPSFLSPFSENLARPYEIDYQVPIEYQMGMQIRDKLPQVNFGVLNEDTLFFLFYLFGNDHVQLLASAELYRRDWRYHKEERLWLTRIKNIMPDQKFETYETGVYSVFDVQLWRKIHKSMRIDYEKLDVNPGAKQQQQDVLASKLLQQQSSIQQQQQQYAPVSSYTSNSSR